MCNCLKRPENKTLREAMMDAFVDLLEMVEVGFDGKMAALEGRLAMLEAKAGTPPMSSAALADERWPDTEEPPYDPPQEVYADPVLFGGIDLAAGLDVTATTVSPNEGAPGQPLSYGETRSWDIKLDHRPRTWEATFDFTFDTTEIEKPNTQDLVLRVWFREQRSGSAPRLFEVYAMRNSVFVDIPLNLTAVELPVSILPGVKYTATVTVLHGQRAGVDLRVKTPTTESFGTVMGLEQMLLPPVGDVRVVAQAGDQFIVENLRINSVVR